MLGDTSSLVPVIPAAALDTCGVLHDAALVFRCDLRPVALTLHCDEPLSRPYVDIMRTPWTAFK